MFFVEEIKLKARPFGSHL